MSSRRNTAHELSPAELRALVQLRLLRFPDAKLLQLLPHCTPAEILADHCTTPSNDIIERRMESALRELQRLDVRVVTVAHADYPESLTKLDNERPPMLFYRGNYELAHAHAVAIVGTRRSTEYGNAAAEMLAGDLARHGVAVISGLALGIDTHAHSGALQAGGQTVAVLGCGIDVWYPQRNARLQERIAQEGLLLSEFAPGEPAMPHHFLQRNRLIALLSGGVVVVEAGMKSGTRNTVDWALRYGLTVCAVPGPIGRDASSGTNVLIQEGAKLVTSVRDIIEELPWRVKPAATSPTETTHAVPIDAVAANILRVLGPVAVQIDRIARAAGRDTAHTLAVLAELELDGLVRQLPGKRFVRL
jgi:DNA processing protein